MFNDLWEACFAAHIVGKPTVVPANLIRTENNSPEAQLIINLSKRRLIMVTPKELVDVRSDPVFEVCVRPIPSIFCQCTDHPLVEHLQNALCMIDNDAIAKGWECGIAAAWALTAKARRKETPEKSTLGDILRDAEFSSDELKQWRMAPCDGFKKVDSKDMWSAKYDEKTLYRYSKKSNEEAVEGAIELVTDRGQRAIGWVQDKMWKTLQPNHVATFVEDIVTRHNTFFAGLCRKKPPMCAILFCTGDADKCFPSALKQMKEKEWWTKEGGVQVLFVGSKACGSLLEPFGASALLTKVRRRSRTKEETKESK